MKDFFDFILSDKVYMAISVVVVLLVVLLIVLIIKLANETSKSKKINKQPMNKRSVENIQNVPRQQSRNMVNQQNIPVQNQHIDTNFNEEAIRTESVVYQKQESRPAPVIEEIPVLKPEVKQEIVDSIKNNNIFETQALNVEMPRPMVEETQMLAKPKPKNLALVSFLEGEVIKEVGIVNSITNIGRDPEVCDIIISNDAHIGRKHALIYFKNDRFYLTDLNSKNGSYINGERLQGEKQISNGDVIKLATTEITFKIC